MPKSNDNIRLTPLGACASCGAYGGSQHQPTCNPGKKFKLAPSRRAHQDAVNSNAFLVKDRIELQLIRNL